MSIGLLLIVGCSTENADTQIEQQKDKLVNVQYLNGDSNVWKAIPQDEMKSYQSNLGSSSTTAKRGNSAHTHGEYITPSSFFSSGRTVSWSGTENNGGAHGSAVMEIPSGSVTISVIMETRCVSILDNEAVYGGTITEVLNDPFGGVGGPYALGNTMIFKVIDNGQGANAPADQYVNTFINSSDLDCSNFPPDAIFWSLPFFSVNDVEEPGSVKVNN